MGRLFFGSVSFERSKEMNSPMKGEKQVLIQAEKNKEKKASRAPAQNQSNHTRHILPAAKR